MLQARRLTSTCPLLCGLLCGRRALLCLLPHKIYVNTLRVDTAALLVAPGHAAAGPQAVALPQARHQAQRVGAPGSELGRARWLPACPSMSGSDQHTAGVKPLRRLAASRRRGPPPALPASLCIMLLKHTTHCPLLLCRTSWVASATASARVKRWMPCWSTCGARRRRWRTLPVRRLVIRQPVEPSQRTAPSRACGTAALARMPRVESLRPACCSTAHL